MLRVIFTFVVLLSILSYAHASAPRPLAETHSHGRRQGSSGNYLCELAEEIEISQNNATSIQGTLEGVPLVSSLFSPLQLWISRSPALYYYFTGVQGRVRINSCNLLQNSTTSIAIFVSSEPWVNGTDLTQFCNEAYGLNSLLPFAGAQGPDKRCAATQGNETLGGGVDLYFCVNTANFYLIRVEQSAFPLGQFQMEISLVSDNATDANASTCAAPPTNINCDAATEIELATPVTGNTALRPLTPFLTRYACLLDMTFTNDVWNPLWYTIRGTGRRFQLTWPSYDYDVAVSLFEILTANNATNNTETCSIENVRCITGRDDQSVTAYQTAAELIWDTKLDAVYRIAVFGYANEAGLFTFEVNEIEGNCTCTDDVIPPGEIGRRSVDDMLEDYSVDDLFYFFDENN